MKVVHVFANKELESRGVRFIDTLEGQKIIHSKLLKKENQSYFSFVIKTVKELLRQDYDWIHAHRISGYIPAIITKFLRPKIKIIYDKHDIHKLDFIFDRLSFFAKEVFVCSKIHLDRMNRFTKRAHFLPNYSIFSPISKSKRESIRKKIGLKKDDVWILFQGSIVRDYGLDTLINAMANIEDRRIKVGIIGWIKEKDYWQELKSKFSKNIFYLGPKDFSEMNNYVGSADIGVVLFKKSRLTIFGNPSKFFEFIACKIPVIVSDVDSVSRYVRKFKNGKIISTINDLKTAIVNLSQKKTREKYSRNSPPLKWSKVGELYIDILKNGNKKRRKDKGIF